MGGGGGGEGEAIQDLMGQPIDPWEWDQEWIR